MSLFQLSRLIRDVEHKDGLLDRLRSNPQETLAGYDLSERERAAVLTLDAQELLDLGVNPLLMRTLLVLNGVGNPELFDHDLSLN